MDNLHFMPGCRWWQLCAVALALSANAAVAGPQIYTGEPVVVGNGTARVIVATNDRDEPTVLSVVLSAAALQGLPEASPSQAVWVYGLKLPAAAPDTGFSHVMLDWNPAGHLPADIYTVAHFDVHFYVIDEAAQSAITFVGADREAAMQAPDQALMASGYVIPPDTEVERMGIHAIDPAGGEFHGQGFSHAFIYGYHKGELVFVEPMVSLAFLQSRPEVTVPVRVPERYSFGAWYPTGYGIGFDRINSEYRIDLTGLQRFRIPVPAAPQAAASH